MAVGSVKAARRARARRREALTGSTAMPRICGEGMEGFSGFKGGHFNRGLTPVQFRPRGWKRRSVA